MRRLGADRAAVSPVPSRSGGPLTPRRTIPPKPTTWGIDPDDWRWENDAHELLHTGLEQVRKTATAWGATISVLLGIFSTVAFIKGPETFNDLSADWVAALAAALIVASALLAGAAVLLAALAAQGIPHWVKQLDGWALKSYYKDQARKARLELAWSRVLAVLAALGVIVGISFTWFETLGQSAPSPKPQPALVTIGGTVKCGALTVAPNGDLLFAVGPSRPVPIAALDATRIVPVAGCPPAG